MAAGTVSTLITAPMDMVKTRLMLQQESKRVGSYKNGFHCAYKVLFDILLLSGGVFFILGVVSCICFFLYTNNILTFIHFSSTLTGSSV